MVKNLESPAKAEAKQAAKRSYLPPVWPLVLALAVVVVIVVLIKH